MPPQSGTGWAIWAILGNKELIKSRNSVFSQLESCVLTSGVEVPHRRVVLSYAILCRTEQ